MNNTQLIVPLYLCDQSLYPIIDRFFTSLSDNYPELELIVIDDCSPLPIPSEWPVSYRNEENLGFTKTVNLGLYMSTADKIIVANDDLCFKRGDLDRFFDMSGDTICSPRDTSSSPDDRFGSIWGITRSALKKLGYLNENYRHYFSDRDYYDRAKKAGITVAKWNDITVDHIESATYKTLGNKDALLKADLEEYERNLG